MKIGIIKNVKGEKNIIKINDISCIIPLNACEKVDITVDASHIVMCSGVFIQVYGKSEEVWKGLLGSVLTI